MGWINGLSLTGWIIHLIFSIVTFIFFPLTIINLPIFFVHTILRIIIAIIHKKVHKMKDDLKKGVAGVTDFTKGPNFKFAIIALGIVVGIVAVGGIGGIGFYFISKNKGGDDGGDGEW